MCRVKTLSDLRFETEEYDGNTIYISDHAFKRLKERAGWNKKTSFRMLKRVYDTGLRKESIKGYMSLWVNHKLASRFADYDEYVLYGGHIYLFRNKVLITVFHAPGREHCIGITNNSHNKKNKERQEDRQDVNSNLVCVSIGNIQFTDVPFICTEKEKGA